MAARTPLLVTALVLMGAVQVGAQEIDWTADRPDAAAPAGVYLDRVLPSGSFELTAQYLQADGEGIRWGTDVYPGAVSFALFEIFDIIPLTQNTTQYILNVAYGIGGDATVVVRGGFAQKSREQLSVDGDYFVIDSDGLMDTEAHFLWEFMDDGPLKAHLHGGVLLPTGGVDAAGGLEGVRTGVLPYDMQTGTGVFGILPGATAQIQNEKASVGGQIMGRIHVGENDRGWQPGNAVQTDVWGAYRFNRFISASARLHGVAWGPIGGADPDLVELRDPGERPQSFGGERVDFPVGVNLYMAEGKLAGHRLSVEYTWNLHEDLEGPWIASSNGFVISWRKIF